MTASPLGKYSDVVAAIVAIIIVTAAIVVHVGLVSQTDTAWLDTSAGLAIGVILGQRATTNGAAILADAANKRIDKLEVGTGISTHADVPPIGVPGA